MEGVIDTHGEGALCVVLLLAVYHLVDWCHERETERVGREREREVCCVWRPIVWMCSQREVKGIPATLEHCKSEDYLHRGCHWAGLKERQGDKGDMVDM